MWRQIVVPEPRRRRRLQMYIHKIPQQLLLVLIKWQPHPTWIPLNLLHWYLRHHLQKRPEYRWYLIRIPACETMKLSRLLPKMCPHIHLPLQLLQMRLSYGWKRYMRCNPYYSSTMTCVTMVPSLPIINWESYNKWENYPMRMRLLRPSPPPTPCPHHKPPP